MLESSASMNTMPLKVMQATRLQFTRPYGIVFGIECGQVQAHGLIQNNRDDLFPCLDISMLMDVVVIDLLLFYGMLLC